MNVDDFEVIPPLKKARRVVRTVVFSADDNFAAVAGVAITALFQTVSPDVFCDVVILDNGISEENRAHLLALGDASRSAVRIFDVIHIAADAPVHSLFTKSTYLRLFIPLLFRTHEKVLYLDCDVLVRRDISELFETEFSGECIAASTDLGIAGQMLTRAPIRFKGRRTTWPRYAKRHLGVEGREVKSLINAGVVLFNVPQCAADDFKVMRNLNRHIHFGYFHHDQCVATRLFRGRIKHLHLRWNFLTLNRELLPLPDWLEREYCETEADPAIVHFVTQIKPWRKFNVLYSGEFWAAARQTVWFQELHEQRLSESFQRWLKRSSVCLPAQRRENPFFSIIVPLYNRADQIERCLKSIQLQGFTDFEIIVIDDASTDGSAGVVEQIACQDARIRLIRLDINIGCAPIRNLGVTEARGKYIRICDSDDFFPPDALSVFADRLAGNEVDVIAGNLIYWISRQRKARHYPGPAKVDRDVQSVDLMELPELWEQIYFHRCAFRRQFLIENRIESPDLRRGADPVFMAEVNAKASSFMLIKDPVYLFHLRQRVGESSFEIMSSSLESHTLVHERMIAAGYAEIAFFFTCFHSPFVTSHEGLTEAQHLQHSARLIELAKRIPLETLDHLYLKHPALDHTGLTHDLLVARNSTPEQVAELIRRNMFCAQKQIRNKEANLLRLKIQNLQWQLRPFRFPLRAYRGLKRRIVGEKAL